MLHSLEREIVYAGDYNRDEWHEVGHYDVNAEGYVIDSLPDTYPYIVKGNISDFPYCGDITPVLDDDVDEDEIDLDEDEELIWGCYIATADEQLGFYTYEHGIKYL